MIMIVTFYSYKGGVGRTQLCANIAAYLCYYKSKKILLWDWDYEAPGLHYYFGKQNDDIVTPGTLELFEAYTRIMRSGRRVSSAELPIIDQRYIVPLVAPNAAAGTGRIDLLPAGCYSDEFSSRANEFNWFEFYDLLDGVTYLEEVKR
jgi:cellulose biosynthesis protein BcsQ